MTAEQHATRAQELTAEAAQLYADLRLDVQKGGGVDDALWRFLDTTIRLGQLHATLSAQQPAPPTEILDYDGRPEKLDL